MIKKFIRYVVSNKYCILHCVLSARLRIDTWIYHGTYLICQATYVAHVQLVSSYNEWLFQKVQGRVPQ